MAMRKFLLLIAVVPILLAASTRTLNGGCSIVFGSNNGSALVDADLGPQGSLCQVPDNATLIEVGVSADGGTPSILPQRLRLNGASTVDLLKAALATGSSGAFACSRATSSTSINGTTACTNTLQNTALSKGDWIQTKINSTGAGGVAKRVSLVLVWTW